MTPLSNDLERSIRATVTRLVHEQHQRAPFVCVGNVAFEISSLRTPHGRVFFKQDITLPVGSVFVVSKRTYSRMRRDGVGLKAEGQ